MTEASTFPHAADVERSLELLAERCGDPAPAVYKRLFAEHPYMEAYFWRDKDGAIKGEMLARTFEAILDFIGERRYAHLMISNEMITHEGYDVPREVFVTFFATIRDTARELLGTAWTPNFESAWAGLLTEIHRYADQTPRVDLDSAHTRAVRARLIEQGLKLP